MGLMDEFLAPKTKIDIAPTTMLHRMHKSTAEIELIRAGAQTADVGGYAINLHQIFPLFINILKVY
jgi:creatinase